MRRRPPRRRHAARSHWHSESRQRRCSVVNSSGRLLSTERRQDAHPGAAGHDRSRRRRDTLGGAGCRLSGRTRLGTHDGPARNPAVRPALLCAPEIEVETTREMGARGCRDAAGHPRSARVAGGWNGSRRPTAARLARCACRRGRPVAGRMERPASDRRTDEAAQNGLHNLPDADAPAVVTGGVSVQEPTSGRSEPQVLAVVAGGSVVRRGERCG